jgi:protein involved in ribonucleotide reduction
MLLVYYSRFGNTKKMLRKLKMDVPYVSIDEYLGQEKYILITPTYGFGEVPVEVADFLANNHGNMVAVISGGNTNWKHSFANSGNVISEKYSVPLLCKFELTGMSYELKQLRKVIGEFNGIYQTE